jgi:hypothetical protein
MHSSSYVPPDSLELDAEVRRLFEQHHEDERVVVRHLTKVYFGRLKR